jgi:hypothetical protein
MELESWTQAVVVFESIEGRMEARVAAVGQ